MGQNQTGQPLADTPRLCYDGREFDDAPRWPDDSWVCNNIMVFVIEDELHDERHGQFATVSDAIAGLKRLSQTPWNEDPNRAPCTNWQACGREYDLVEFDDGTHPWREVRRIPALSVSQAGVKWLSDLAENEPPAPT